MSPSHSLTLPSFPFSPFFHSLSLSPSSPCCFLTRSALLGGCFLHSPTHSLSPTRTPTQSLTHSLRHSLSLLALPEQLFGSCCLARLGAVFVRVRGCWCVSACLLGRKCLNCRAVLSTDGPRCSHEQGRGFVLVWFVRCLPRLTESVNL